MSAPFRFPRFFVTSPAPCPYLAGKTGEIVAALLAQGMAAYDAACLAVWLHARAGEVLAVQGRGLAAGDLPCTIRQLLEEVCPCTK